MVEQLIRNEQVVGSIPTGGFFYFSLVNNFEMDIVSQNNPLSQYFHRFTLRTWNVLRDPQLTVATIAALIIITLLGMIIPQQVASSSNALWMSNLPSSVQPWGELLILLGISHLFRSLWFWLPAAVLLLNSFIILADDGPASWQRLHTAPLEWQHPLAHRAEYTISLPPNADEFLITLKKSLVAKGFSLYEPLTPALIEVAQYRESWVGLLALHLGLVLLVFALLMSHYTLNTDAFSIFPSESRSSQLLNGKFELTETEANQGTCQISYTPTGDEQSAQILTWQLYQPKLFNQAITMLTAFDPILTVEVRDKTNKLVKLIPKQEDLAPSERLNFSLENSNQPFYFQIPQTNLTIQIMARLVQNEGSYNIQVLRHSENSPSVNITVQTGEIFKFDSYTATVFLNYKVNIVAYRDPALSLYLVAALLIMSGIWFGFLRPPLQLWLFIEIKGTEGRLHAVAEKFAPLEDITKFLEIWLTSELLNFTASTDEISTITSLDNENEALPVTDSPKNNDDQKFQN